MTDFKIIDVYVGDTEFEGETFTKARAVLADGRELTIADSVEDLQACGSMEKVTSSLRYHEGQFGPYLRLSRYKKTSSLF